MIFLKNKGKAIHNKKHKKNQFAVFLDAQTAFYNEDIYTPFSKLSARFQKVLISDSGKQEIPFYFEKGGRRITYKKKFEGVIPNLKRRSHETDSHQSREEIKQDMNFTSCSRCKDAVIAKGIIAEITERLGFITSVGFDYFTPNRSDGTPEEIAELEGSHTGRFLKEILKR